MFTQKFMDGTPVPADYQERISRLVSAAACADVDELNEDAVREASQKKSDDHE